jgi:hypothetical protein
VGLAVHQTVVVAAAGTPDERRLQVLEDSRITPELRSTMWGGPKDSDQLAALVSDPALRTDLKTMPIRRGLLRLTDRDGRVLAERRLDCELGEIAEPALQQGDSGSVWGVGDDCSTGEGDFAGLITRFLAPPKDRIVFQAYDDAATGERNELTLVSAAKIQWHLAVPHSATLVHELSCHPDFSAKDTPGPLIVEYVTYRWSGAEGIWHRTERTERDKPCPLDFPPDDAFL